MSLGSSNCMHPQRFYGRSLSQPHFPLFQCCAQDKPAQMSPLPADSLGLFGIYRHFYETTWTNEWNIKLNEWSLNYINGLLINKRVSHKQTAFFTWKTAKWIWKRRQWILDGKGCFRSLVKPTNILKIILGSLITFVSASIHQQTLLYSFIIMMPIL